MAANEGKILPLPPQAAMTEAPHIAVESPGDGKLRQIGFAQAVDDVVNLRGTDYADTILPDQTGHAGMVLQSDGTTADWAYVQTIRLYVKNESGSAITKGQAVYISGSESSGNNALISLAQANSEPTSSKTLGLVETTSIANNGFGWVVTEGLLDTVDTSAATAQGDTIWLSPTTAGGLVYGLANKPSAPNHMVFIGYVVRKQSNNGKIYVKPQNGFELEELHNVAISSPTTGQVLQYDATLSPPRWKNATVSGGGGGSGDVTGPASSTDNAIARFDLATGKVIQNSAVTVDDTGNILGAQQVNATSVVSPSVVVQSQSSGIRPRVDIYEDVANGSNYIGLRTPSAISANAIYDLPATDGTSGQVLKTSGTKILSFGDVSIDNVTGAKFTSDITVNLSGGRTFGRYATGDIIPATNKTANEVIILAAVQATPPTASLSVSGSVPFGTTSTTLTATYSYAGTGGATITSTSLEWRRGNTGAWTVLSTGASPYTHNLTYTRFLTSVINYRLVVTDSNSLQTIATYDVTPEAYSAPSVSSWNVGTTSRDLGDIARTITATITRNRTNVPITGWRLIRNANGTETTISTNTVTTNPATISVSVSDSGFSTATTSLYYRLEYTDEYVTSYAPCTGGTSSTVSFSHRFYYGASTLTDVTTVANIESLTQGSLTSSRSSTLSSVSATTSQYYYYCYPSSAGDLTSVIQDGAYQVLGSFQNTAPANSEPTSPKTVTGTNTFGASVSYRVYKTTAKGAFTNVTLAFS